MWIYLSFIWGSYNPSFASSLRFEIIEQQPLSHGFGRKIETLFGCEIIFAQVTEAFQVLTTNSSLSFRGFQQCLFFHDCIKPFPLPMYNKLYNVLLWHDQYISSPKSPNKSLTRYFWGMQIKFICQRVQGGDKWQLEAETMHMAHLVQCRLENSC